MSDDYASISQAKPSQAKPSQAKPINIVALLDAIVKSSFVNIYILNCIRFFLKLQVFSQAAKKSASLRFCEAWGVSPAIPLSARYILS